jgi:hypothetical protein
MYYALFKAHYLTKFEKDYSMRYEFDNYWLKFSAAYRTFSVFFQVLHSQGSLQDSLRYNQKTLCKECPICPGSSTSFVFFAPNRRHRSYAQSLVRNILGSLSKLFCFYLLVPDSPGSWKSLVFIMHTELTLDTLESLYTFLSSCHNL